MLLVSGLLLVLAAAPASAAPRCANAAVAPAQVSKATADRATLCLLNRIRVRRGLERLRYDRKLAVAARRHATDMVRRRYFDHRAPDGGNLASRIFRTGYAKRRGEWRFGENLAWADAGYDSPRAIVQAWMESPGHRRNILGRRFRDVGFAIVPGTPWGQSTGATYAHEFACRC